MISQNSGRSSVSRFLDEGRRSSRFVLLGGLKHEGSSPRDARLDEVISPPRRHHHAAIATAGMERIILPVGMQRTHIAARRYRAARLRGRLH
jgi:hypothetical protein